MYCNKCGTKVDPNTKFCNKCGNQLTNNIQTPVVSNNSNHNTDNRRMIYIGVVSGIVGLIIVLVIALIINITNPNYFFSNDNHNIDQGGNVQSINNEPQKPKNGESIIVTDNVYEGVSVSTDTDAYKLISKDSTDQKDKCPKKILKVEKNIIKKYGITAVNLCEMNVDFAEELEKVLDKIYTDYPMARGHITNISLWNTKGMDSSGVIAAFMPIFNFATSDSSTTYPWVIKTQVLLSSRYFLNESKLETAVKESSAAGHFPPNSSKYSPVAHELGHYLSYLTILKKYSTDSTLLIDNNSIDAFFKIRDDFAKGDQSLIMLKEAHSNYQKDKNTTIDFDKWRGTISAYALAKNNNGDYIYDESIAEAFHDTYLNGDNAKDASKYIVQVLKKHLGNG